MWNQNNIVSNFLPLETLFVLFFIILDNFIFKAHNTSLSLSFLPCSTTIYSSTASARDLYITMNKTHKPLDLRSLHNIRGNRHGTKITDTIETIQAENNYEKN